MEVMTFIWIAAIVLFAVVEVTTVSLFSIWFVFGSLVSCIISMIWPDAILVQVIVCLVVSSALLAFTRPIIKNKIIKKQTATNADMNIGKRAQVIEAISKDMPGRVKLNGLTWKASANCEIQADEWCVVTNIEGVTLVVQKEEQKINEEEKIKETV